MNKKGTSTSKKPLRLMNETLVIWDEISNGLIDLYKASVFPLRLMNETLVIKRANWSV